MLLLVKCLKRSKNGAKRTKFESIDKNTEKREINNLFEGERLLVKFISTLTFFRHATSL